jgi:hypothetical protein
MDIQDNFLSTCLKEATGLEAKYGGRAHDAAWLNCK